MAEEEAQEAPKLDPRYVPAESDNHIYIRFVGNTSTPAYIELVTDPWTMVSIGEYIRDKGKQQIAMIEAAMAEELRKEAQEKEILTAGRIPDPDEMPDILKSPGVQAAGRFKRS